MVFAVTLVICRILYSSRKQMLHLLVENLPGELARLLENDAAIFGVGVVAEIRALVDEALAASR